MKYGDKGADEGDEEGGDEGGGESGSEDGDESWMIESLRGLLTDGQMDEQTLMIVE